MAKRVLNIPDTDHIARYVPYARQARDPVSDELLGSGLLWNSLQQRKGEEFVSVNWMECADVVLGRSLNKLSRIGVIKEHLSELGFGKNIKSGLFASANVGKLKSTCSEFGMTVRVTHEPTDRNPTHAGIRRLSSERDDLLETLAAEVFLDTFLVKNI